MDLRFSQSFGRGADEDHLFGCWGQLDGVEVAGGMDVRDPDRRGTKR